MSGNLTFPHSALDIRSCELISIAGAWHQATEFDVEEEAFSYEARLPLLHKYDYYRCTASEDPILPYATVEQDMYLAGVLALDFSRVATGGDTRINVRAISLTSPYVNRPGFDGGSNS